LNTNPKRTFRSLRNPTPRKPRNSNAKGDGFRPQNELVVGAADDDSRLLLATGFVRAVNFPACFGAAYFTKAPAAILVARHCAPRRAAAPRTVRLSEVGGRLALPVLSAISISRRCLRVATSASASIAR
jgi:hypothetical protein